MSESERSDWAVAAGIATIFMQAAVLARTRMLDHASPIVRMMGQRDAASHDAALLELEEGCIYTPAEAESSATVLRAH